MDPFLIVSPHLDDGVLSCGQFLAAWPGAHVLTLFAGMPPSDLQSSFDESCGFGSSAEAITSRRHEDDRALRVLRAIPLRAAFLDHQYRWESDPPVADLATVIVNAANAIGATRVAGPLGLLHPDHVLAAAATRRVHELLPDWDVYAYEELPSRVMAPEVVRDALLLNGLDYGTAKTTFIGVGAVEQKETAIRCYASQTWAWNPHELLVPERYWQL